MRTFGFIGLTWVSLLCFAPRAAWGQDVSAPATPAKSTENGVENGEPKLLEPISSADITSRAAEVVLELDRIEQKIVPRPAVTDLALEISSQTKTIVELASKLNAFTVTTVSARQIEDQRGKWRQIQVQLDGWMSRADARWQELQATRAELKQIEKQWQLTRDAESTAELPEEVTRRIDAIIARAGSLLNSTQQRIDQVARIVDQLSEAHQLSTTSLDRVGKLSEGATRRLITRTVPPLWQTPSTDWLGLHETAWTVSQTWVHDLLAFAADYWVRLLLHLLVFVGLATATVIARRSSHDWPEEHELDRARFLLDKNRKPISSCQPTERRRE